MSASIRRCCGDAGQVGGIEVLPLGFLIFVAVPLLLVNTWGVIDAKLATTSASREAVRTFVEAPNLAEAVANAELRGAETLAAYGRDGERAVVETPVLADGYVRCGRVTLTVTYQVPALDIPFLGGFGDVITVESTSTELIDPFRDGLPGVAMC